MDENLPPNPNPSSVPPLVNPPPPLYSSPPIITPPSGSPPRRQGNFWKILALLLLVGLGLSIFYNFRRVTHFFPPRQSKNIHHKKQSLEEILLEDNNAASKIAVLELSGIISSKAFDRSDENIVEATEQQLKAAEEDKSVKAVVLKINSPGGEVLASDEINHLIADFQTRAKKPVVASMQTLAASGGYYVSAPCQWIVANDMTITGSIGVIMHGYNYRGLLTKIGVRPDTYKSGKLKDMLSGEKLPEEILPEEREIVQELIMETYGKFTNVVATGRADS
ncbi:MAG: signal peptide peptidase SppA, partial [Limisphaerales bacterium]